MIARWKYLSPQQRRLKQASTQWRLHGSPPDEVLHTPHDAWFAELAPGAAAVALAVVEDFLLPTLCYSLEASDPAATTVEAVKHAVATSSSQPEEA